MKMPLMCVIVIALARSVLSGQQPSGGTGDPEITGAFVHGTVTSLKDLLREK
jgi:hypothetical protein